MAMAAFIDHWAMIAKDGESDALLEWLQKNEARLAAALPEGSQWLGLYGEVVGGEGPGWWHMLIGLEKYGTIDTVYEAARDPGSELGGLLADLFGYFDQTNQARGGRWLWRAAPYIKIWE